MFLIHSQLQLHCNHPFMKKLLIWKPWPYLLVRLRPPPRPLHLSVLRLIWGNALVWPTRDPWLHWQVWRWRSSACVSCAAPLHSSGTACIQQGRSRSWVWSCILETGTWSFWREGKDCSDFSQWSFAFVFHNKVCLFLSSEQSRTCASTTLSHISCVFVVVF